jgi:hypothetical protein
VRIAFVNARIDDWRSIWPDGRPVDYLIALSICRDDPEQTRRNLSDQGFTRVVRAEAAARGFGLMQPQRMAGITKMCHGKHEGSRRRGLTIPAPEADEAEGRVSFMSQGIRFTVGGAFGFRGEKSG